jgi:proteasome lid subunit RPN8/RPN11
VNEERARDRFEMDPRDFLQAEEDAAHTGEEILGFYHSHPDHPAWPSPTDLLRAQPWPGYYHLIVAVRAAGFQKDARVWQVTEDEEGFVEEELRVEGS